MGNKIDLEEIMQTQTIPLKETQLPLVGFGTFLISNEDAEVAVYEAIKSGYRHIDTAQGYYNELGIGKAIQRAISENLIQRDDLYITTKLWPGNEEWGDPIKDYQSTLTACEESLSQLQLDFIDLYLIHAPFAKQLRLEQWKAFLQLQESGKVKDIGVCNYNKKHFVEIEEAGLPLPSVNQIELHPWSQKQELLSYMKEKGIKPIAYSSLVPLSNWRENPGQDSAKSEAMKQEGKRKDSVFKMLSEKYQVSEAQILLKWAVQQEIPVIPKTVNPLRMKENLDLFSFSLTDEDLNYLNTLNKGDGVAWPAGDPSNYQN
jgi:2,5-diketo-D-gluconate reductase A